MDNRREQFLQKTVNDAMNLDEIKRLIDITTIYKLLMDKGIVTDKEITDTKEDITNAFKEAKESQYKEQIEKMSDGELMVCEMFSNMGIKTEK